MKNDSLDLLRTVGEEMSKGYEINWENWAEDEASLLEARVLSQLPASEAVFLRLGESIRTNSYAGNLADVLSLYYLLTDNLIKSYAIQSLIKRKREIESFVDTI